jgi:hypothetical protein
MLLFFKMDLLSKARKLKNCTVKRGIMTIEYDAINTPPKAEILRFTGKISEPCVSKQPRA